MNRRRFGGGLPDWAFAFGADGGVIQAPGAVLTFWDSLVAGNQYPAAPMPGGVDDGTGLLDGTGTPISSVTTDSNGEIPDAIQGPDTIYKMAADASGAGTGPRRWIYANDMGDDIAALDAQVTSLAALGMAPVYVYYDTTLAAYPARPPVSAPVWWVGPVSPPVGGGSASGDDIWLNTSGTSSPSGVTSVSAADASVVLGGTPGAPTIETATLDVIATLHPPAAPVPMNGQKLTGGAAGTAGSDFATVSQLSGTLVPTGVKTGAYTAAAADLVLVSTASGSVPVTLPAAAADKTRVGVKIVTLGGGNTASIAASGTDRFNVAGGSAVLILSRLFQTVTMQYELSAGLWLVTGTDVAFAPAYGGMFGDGSDGAAVFDGTTANAGFTTTTGSAPNLSYTLARDIFATACTVSAGITVSSGDFRIFCAGAFTLNGTLTRPGPAAAGATAGAGTGGGTLDGGLAGAAGGTGGGANGGKGSATAGCGSGGAGGGSGSSGGSHSGGSTRSPVFATMFPFRLPSAILAGIPAGSQLPAVQAAAGGCGGSAGGGDGTNSGGGGGSGGGLIAVFAWSVTIASGATVSVPGGAGGSAAAGNCGGGGGGGGGLFAAYTVAPWVNSGTFAAAGGAGGAGAGTGSAGSPGTAGAQLNVIVQ